MMYISIYCKYSQLCLKLVSDVKYILDIFIVMSLVVHLLPNSQQGSSFCVILNLCKFIYNNNNK